MSSQSESGPAQAAMLELNDVLKWSNAQICEWLGSINAGGAVPCFQQHGIEGSELSVLTKEDLHYMQVPLGAGLRILLHLEDVVRAKKQADDKKLIEQRNRVVNEWPEFYGNCYFPFCQGVKDYKLTGTSLYVKAKAPFCCGAITNDNIDLSNIKDVDNVQPGWQCTDMCLGAKGFVIVTDQGGQYNIACAKDETEALANTIRETWELAQLQAQHTK